MRALLRDAEADVERQRELRREREELVLELRWAGMRGKSPSTQGECCSASRTELTLGLMLVCRDDALSARGSPLRAPRSPAPRTGPLKSALKKPAASTSTEPAAPPPPPAPPLPWQSARATPVSPEAAERLARARRGVLPDSRGPRLSSSIAERDTSTEQEDGAGGSVLRARSAAGVRVPGQVRSRSADTMRGRRAPTAAEAVTAGLDRSGRSASAPRRRPQHDRPLGGSKVGSAPGGVAGR